MQLAALPHNKQLISTLWKKERYTVYSENIHAYIVNSFAKSFGLIYNHVFVYVYVPQPID